MLSPSKSRDALPASSNYMSSSQLADYLTDLRAARAARVNSGRTETSPTRSVRRRSPERSPERSTSRPLRDLPIHCHDETLEARRREQEEVLSIRMALENIDLKEEKGDYELAHEDALDSLITEQSSKSEDAQTNSSGSTDSAISIPAEPKSARSTGVGEDRVRFAPPQAPKIAEVNREQNEDPESPQTYTKTFKKKGYQGLAKAVAADIANSRQRISSGTRRKASASRPVFPNTRDKIFEEHPGHHGTVVQDAVPDMPRHIRKNPFARVKFTQDRVAPAADIDNKKPEQKTSPKKLTKLPATSMRTKRSIREAQHPPTPDQAHPADSEQGVPRQDCRDLRNEVDKTPSGLGQADQRTQATRPAIKTSQSEFSSIQFRPRRPPVIGRDDPPRPVSRNQQHIHPAMRTPSYPQIRVPSLPSIAVPVDIPAICISEETSTPVANASSMVIPTISFSGDGDDTMSCQTLPENSARDTSSTTNAHFKPSVPVINISEEKDESAWEAMRPGSSTSGQSRRPTMQHAATLPSLHDSKPYLPPRSIARNPTLCGQCALPIAGRVLSAAGERLHPECFNCHECSTNLECVAFYPEPDQKYYERIARIQQRLSGLEVGVPVDMRDMDAAALEEKDGDDSLRYFCHLDFHELFSPRCKSCKTPIEGEVVVACGAEWHVGHFFCAQCGDPFDADKPFVEQDNYAWCVGCHLSRFSPKCNKCKKPVTDLVLNALGAEWHGECFCCIECGDQFEDGQFFLRGQSKDPVCVKCEDKRLKA